MLVSSYGIFSEHVGKWTHCVDLVRKIPSFLSVEFIPCDTQQRPVAQSHHPIFLTLLAMLPTLVSKTTWKYLRQVDKVQSITTASPKYLKRPARSRSVKEQIRMSSSRSYLHYYTFSIAFIRLISPLFNWRPQSYRTTILLEYSLHLCLRLTTV